MYSFKYYFNNPRIVMIIALKKFGKFLSDETFIKLMFRAQMGYKLNLKNPTTFNEKIQWLKLFNRRPLYTKMVDKFAVKAYVADIIGEQYIIPTLGVWKRPEEIDWEELPEQFVLKTTHGGGNTGVVICKNKSTFNKQGAIEKLKKSLDEDLYVITREWPYKNVPKQIIAEALIEGKNGDLPDYKFFCFDGDVKALFIGTERSSGNVKFDYYDADFNHLDLVQSHPMSGKIIDKPYKFEEMKAIASKLSKGIPHVRVDLYESNGNIFFGELTFFHHGGVVPFHPTTWDNIFGNWITLPTKTF